MNAEEWQPPRGPVVDYGLALSGGGYRATLFHIGAIMRMNDMGRLRSIGRVSGVSGGSFTAALLAKAWSRLDWDEQGRATNLESEFVGPGMDLTRRKLDVPLVLLGVVPGINPAHLLARTLDAIAFHGMTLQDLPDDGDGPRFVFNASEMATGTLFRFSKPYMGSWRIGLVEKPRLRVATAVAASAAFPPIMSPLILRMDPSKVRRVNGADLWADEALRGRATLLDGGVYDNLALETIDDRCHTYLVSDAGGNFKVDTARWKSWLWLTQLKRTLDTAVAQARSLRRSALFQTAAQHPFAIWRTISDPSSYEPSSGRPFPVQPDWPRYMAGLPTRMWPFSDVDQSRLVNWGYLMSDLALRSFVWADDDGPDKLPFPRASFEDAPTSAPPIAGASHR